MKKVLIEMSAEEVIFIISSLMETIVSQDTVSECQTKIIDDLVKNMEVTL